MFGNDPLANYQFHNPSNPPATHPFPTFSTSKISFFTSNMTNNFWGLWTRFCEPSVLTQYSIDNYSPLLIMIHHHQSLFIFILLLYYTSYDISLYQVIIHHIGPAFFKQNSRAVHHTWTSDRIRTASPRRHQSMDWFKGKSRRKP